MNRRDALHSISAVTIASLTASVDAKGHGKVRGTAAGLDRNFYLSPLNPLATIEQRELELQAHRVMEMPAVQQARKVMEAQWRTVSANSMDDEARAMFDGMITEYLYINVLKAVNSDPNYPKVLANSFAPPHEWFGLKNPGSRIAGPNPDNTYRHIPLDPTARYEINGRCIAPVPVDFGFTLMSNMMFTRRLPLLTNHDLKVAADGSFTITLGPDAAKGRPNHLQMPSATRWMFIRDSRSDWRQVASAVRVRRIDAPTAAPLTDAEIATRAVEIMFDDLPNTYWWMLVARQSGPNTMTRPDNTGSMGGLATQQTSFGHLHLGDDDAVVVTTGGGGAAYRSLALYDHWYRCMDPAEHMSSMTHEQAAPNDDGSITHVISNRDPGVHNWLDAGGHRELLVLHRWQGLPTQRTAEQKLFLDARFVKLDDLAKALPSGVKTVSADERKQQFAERVAQYRLRYLDA